MGRRNLAYLIIKEYESDSLRYRMRSFELFCDLLIFQFAKITNPRISYLARLVNCASRKIEPLHRFKQTPMILQNAVFMQGIRRRGPMDSLRLDQFGFLYAKAFVHWARVRVLPDLRRCITSNIVFKQGIRRRGQSGWHPSHQI